ncbi:PAS domain-containing sensor histidine kinase [Bullifex porci]|uniref:sensor histidine kinase n=2 Tax=Bullifex porci TaxID=2606638 RepID=UPI0023F41F98|nr:HAMP domain-containing sensor histidine kinase [Bullifex porci]MDD7255232.1 HAMP domain-containing sensor histidine kinase [Bullifex porci]MDY2741923.1 HAMP domain-containing sensor histidine kinase [Bullifex porci]
MKKKTKNRLISFFSRAKRERLIVIASLSVAFLALLTLVIVLASSLFITERLKLVNEIEKNFNNVVFELQRGNFNPYSFLSEKRVKGIALYDSRGSIMVSYGQVYNMLPIASISEEANKNEDNNIIRLNFKSNTMEYTRLLRVPLVISDVNYDGDSSRYFPSSLIDYTTIMYIAFDASSYLTSIKVLMFCTVVILLGILFLYVFVIRTYLENRRYKAQMVKQENLVNLGQAARTLTHEIKNPLSAITIQIALLKRQLKDSEYLEEVELISKEVQRLIQLTNRVSDFLKNPEGQPEEIDVVEMINSLIPLFSYEIKVLPESQKSATILFDRDRLRSVLENLLKNAIESCEGRDPKVEVEITLDRRNIYHIFIRDRGDGIKKGDTEKLFDPFFTTKIHGSGIGLSISRQFLRARGGDIKLYPRPDGGSVAEVTISKFSLVQELVLNGPTIKKKKGE